MFRTDKFKKSDYFLGACSLGIQQEFLIDSIYEVKIKYWKEIVGPE